MWRTTLSGADLSTSIWALSSIIRFPPCGGTAPHRLPVLWMTEKKERINHRQAASFSEGEVPGRAGRRCFRDISEWLRLTAYFKFPLTALLMSGNRTILAFSFPNGPRKNQPVEI